MNVAIIGGGSWGATLGQVLCDNGNDVLIRDIALDVVNGINKDGSHPFLEVKLTDKLKATTDLKEAIDFAEYIILAVPTKFMRQVLEEISQIIKEPKIFINVSKGIEPNTLKRVSQIVSEVIDPNYVKGYACLSGPSHAEELVLRKITLLVAASDNMQLAQEVQHLFHNENYLRVYTSNDVCGVEVGGAIKNAIAVVSGISTGFGLGENARAALISRGILEIIKVVEIMGGKKETAFGLTGIGDLIVTASSENSRNFKAGKKIGQGQNVDDVIKNSKMVVEGVRTIVACHDLINEYKIELPLIEAAYRTLFEGEKVEDMIKSLINRELKSE